MARTSLLILIAGCSVQQSIPLGALDGGNSASCAQAFVACGGDPSGTWNLASLCGTEPAPGLCATSSLSFGFAGTATMAFDAGTLTSTNMITYDYTTDASSCLGGSDGDTCAAINALVPQQSCAATSTSACVCTWSTPLTSSSTGTYTVAAGEISITTPTVSTYTLPYCIQGNTMIVATSGTTSEIWAKE